MVVAIGDVFWKSVSHKEYFDKVMDKLGRDIDDAYYTSFAYILSATGKAEYLLQFLDKAGVSSVEIKEAIQPYSNSEKSMILFALQLFNSNMSDITLPDTIASLDSHNYKVILEAIQIRYGRVYYK